MRAAGSARTDGSAPLNRGEFPLDNQRVFGDPARGNAFCPSRKCSFHCLPLDERYPPFGAGKALSCRPAAEAQNKLICVLPDRR
jgi:hypothetical protein